MNVNDQYLELCRRLGHIRKCKCGGDSVPVIKQGPPALEICVSCNRIKEIKEKETGIDRAKEILRRSNAAAAAGRRHRS